MTYQLWDMTSRNMIDEFETDSEAAVATRAYLTPDEYGQTVAVALVVYDDADMPVRSIHGDELVAFLNATDAGPARRTA